MSKINQPTCPLCKSNDNGFLSSYLGSFLSCKELFRCQSCDLVFAFKLPSKDELAEYYSSGLYYDQVADPFKPEFLDFSFKLAQSRLKLIFSCININNTSKVIDIGAGNAQLGIALKQSYVNVFYDIVEPDKEVTGKYGNHVNNQFADISELQVGGYDLAVINQVLEHVPDPVNFLDSVCKLLKTSGFVYIDVPYQDFLFKPSLEPHLLFWNQKSIPTLIEKTGLKMIFCDTAGMPHSQAKIFFNQQSLLQKFQNPWFYIEKAALFLKKTRMPEIFNTFRRFQSDQYGGDRQWLRCIAQKMD